MGEFVRIAGTADVKPGQAIVVEAAGKTLALFNVDGTTPSTTPVSIAADRWAKAMSKGRWCPARGTAGSSM
jgi:hypothetical protein